MTFLTTCIRISTFSGFAPKFSTPMQFKGLERARDVVNLTTHGHESRTLAAQSEIRQVTCLYQSQIDTDESITSYFTHSATFDRLLDQIKDKYFPEWTPNLEILLLGSKLYLYALSFVFISDLLSSSLPLKLTTSISAQHYLVVQKGLHSALQLINTISDISLSTRPNIADYPVGLLTFHPKSYFTDLYFAVMFIFRVAIGDNQVFPTQNRKDIVSALQAAHKIFRSFPSHRDHARAALNVEFAVQIIRERSQSHSQSTLSGSTIGSLFVTNRLGASLLYDGSFHIGEVRNREMPLTTTTTNESRQPGLSQSKKESNILSSDKISSWKTLSEQYPEFLPEAPKPTQLQVPLWPAIDSTLPANSDEALFQGTFSIDGGNIGQDSIWTDWNQYIVDNRVSFDLPAVAPAMQLP
ncbi:hypothetical protein LTR84_011126 [Exophiala bonariae]|uniref:Transcription factor domain-containing protein n=1 Tax=Exophiala bonariae TaxID=1690606 RepID=A0AAV9NI96_9EURO|nr:hypothetical protein LTR84_011126 [Exophiala bonariae]